MSGEVGGAGGAYSYNALKRLDSLWGGICTASSGVFCYEFLQFIVLSYCRLTSKRITFGFDLQLFKSLSKWFQLSLVCFGNLGCLKSVVMHSM